MNKKIIVATIVLAMLPIFFVPSVSAALNTTAGTYAIVHVTNTAPTVNTVSVSPDPADPGNTLTILANVTDPNSDITSVVVVLDMGTPGNTGDDVTLNMTYNGTSSLYENLTYALASDALAGTWYANVTATDSGASTGTGYDTFTVNSFVALSLTQTPIDFGNASIGTTDRRADNGTAGSGYTGGTIKGFPMLMSNDGNVNVNFTMKGDNLVGQTNPAYNIGISNLKAYDSDTLGSAFAMSTSYQSIGTTTTPGNSESAYFWLTIPSGLPEQDYRGNVTVMALQA